jgi:hypothetical protein
MIFVQDIDDDIRHVVCADRANTVMLGKLPDRGMPVKGWISRTLPHSVFCEYAYKTIDIVSVYRIAIDFYQPRTFVLDLQPYRRIHDPFS